MSETQNPFDSRRLPVVFIIAGIIVLGGFSGAIGVGGGSAGGACTASNQLCDQILFDQAVHGNTTLPAASMISTPWTATLNETLVLIADSNAGGVITSITDTGRDTFTRQLLLSQNGPPAQNFEIWTAKTKAATGTLSTVTVTWNFTTNNVFVMSSYLNVAGIGNVSSTQSPTGATSGSVVAIPFFSGSKIVGGTSVSPSGTLVCNTIVAGTFLVQRRDSCSKNVITPEVEVDIEDNMTVLRNTQGFTFSASWPIQGVVAFQMGTVELIGFDKEPSFPNFNNFCTTVNGLCVTTQYTINSVRMATGVNALNQVLTLNQVYCTGITTAALTTSKTDTVLSTANYGGVSLNQTGAKMLVQLKIGTAVPTTVFGLGVCAVGAVVATMDLTFTLSGALSATNAYSAALNGSPGESAGTYYAWLEITPQNFVGHINYDQVVNQVYCFASIFMQEEK